MEETEKDPRIVYGAMCTWWDSIDKAGTTGPHKMPCCPHCRGMLFECPNEAGWNELIERFSLEHAGYKDYITWARGRCFKNWDAARRQYRTEKGI